MNLLDTDTLSERRAKMWAEMVAKWKADDPVDEGTFKERYDLAFATISTKETAGCDEIKVQIGEIKIVGKKPFPQTPQQ